MEPQGALDLKEEQLRKLPTKRLLAVFKKVRALRSSSSKCSCGCGAAAYEDWVEGDAARYRSWQERYDLIKGILAEREHVEK